MNTGKNTGKNTSQITMKWNMIFTKDELSRLSISESQDDTNVTLDIHGMKCIETKIMINNIAATIRTPFTIRVIHGYNHGHDTKDMIADETKMSNRRIRARIPEKKNPGVTDLVFMGA